MDNSKYNHSVSEDKVYKYWEKNKLFKPKKNKRNFRLLFHPLM